MRITLRRIVLGICLLLLVFFLIQTVRPSPVPTPHYSNFVKQLEEGKVGRVDLDAKINNIAVYLKTNNGEKAKPDYQTGYPSNTEQTLTNQLKAQNVEVSVQDLSTNPFTSILSFLLPLIIIIALWIFFIGQSAGGGMKQMGQFAKSRARRIDPGEVPVAFRDVAGIDEALEEVKEMKDFLSDPKRYMALGARIPKGLLLSGPPGTGKTLIARALAAEAGVPFWETSGSEFLEMFVGVGASRIRSMFEEAKKEGQGVIFIDELDAIGRQRGAGIGGGNDERENAVNQLLVEMDGFNSQQNVIVVAATNRPDVLDPALLRPGRFDRHITVDLPDRGGREQILKVHARSKPLGDSVNMPAVAAGTAGMSGADLENLLNEAAILTARRSGTTIEQSDVDAALLRIVAGPEKKARILPPHELSITAYHELGHAIVGHVLEHTDPIERVSIVARGRALGFTLSLPSEDRYLISRAKLRDEMAMTLGGRAAEALIFGDVTTGASGDLERVTQVAKQMVMRWAMNDDLGQRVFGRDQSNPFLGKEMSSESDYSERIADEIDGAIKQLVDEAYTRAIDLLQDHREQLDEMAAALLERETFTRDEFEALFNHQPLPEHADARIFGHERVQAETPSIVENEHLSADELAELRLLIGERSKIIVHRDGSVTDRDGGVLGHVTWQDRLREHDHVRVEQHGENAWLVWIADGETNTTNTDEV